MTSKWLDVANRQAGVISTSQLLECGLLKSQVRSLASIGTIVDRGRGVWVMSSSAQCWEQSLWLLLSSAGPDAFAFRRTAATLLGLDGVEHGWLEVAVPHSRRPRSADVTRVRSISPSDLKVVNGIPTTSAARTVVDLASACGNGIAERALESAFRLKLTNEHEVLQVASMAGHVGAARVRAVLRNRPPGTPPTGSDAETLFLQIARSMGLPAPARQVMVILRGKKYKIDFAWPFLRLAVEIDGATNHGPSQFEADIVRQNSIVLDGWTILRFSWYSVARRTGIVERDLRTAWRQLSAGIA